MITCPKCNKEYEDSANYCNSCEIDLPKSPQNMISKVSIRDKLGLIAALFCIIGGIYLLSQAIGEDGFGIFGVSMGLYFIGNGIYIFADLTTKPE